MARRVPKLDRRIEVLQLVDFHAVASHGGLTAASAASGTPKTTLARRIRIVESGLGVRLFHRGPRALRLTPEGEALQSRTARAIAELKDAADDIASLATHPRGQVRVSVPGFFAQEDFGAFAARFVAAYPETIVEVVVQDRFVDPVAEAFDVVVRVNPASDSVLVGQLLWRDRFVVAATSGIPRPSKAHEIVPAVVLTGRPDGEEWTFEDEETTTTIRTRAVLRLASMVLIRDAVLQGAGGGLLPERIAAPEIAAGRIQLWGTLRGRDIEVWALSSSLKLRSAKVNAFMGMLKENYGKRPI